MSPGPPVSTALTVTVTSPLASWFWSSVTVRVTVVCPSATPVTVISTVPLALPSAGSLVTSTVAAAGVLLTAVADA